MHNQALRDLVRGAQAGNLRDFAALVQQFQDMAVGYSQVLLEDFHLAEDAAQDAFVQAFIHLKQLDAPEAFPGWFRRIVFSCCMRYRRREKDVVLSLDMALGVHCQEPLPDAVLAQRERSRLLHRALGSLDEPEKTTVMLYYIRDHTQGEIAAFMGVSTTAVKKRLHSAKEKLHRRLLVMIRENGSRISPSKDHAFARKVLDRVEEIQGVPLFARGKVRDVYDLGDRLLIVATDRISAYDCIMPNGIPQKGKILTEMSLFWFDKTRDIVKNHLITANVADYPQALKPYADVLDGRSMVVVKANRIDIECVARGYLSGSGWREYKASGTVCGIKLPAGLREFDRLAEPIFTPATKAETGHDENISFERLCEVVDPGLAAKLRDLTLKIYGFARDYAESRGIIIADTKFEFGLLDGEIILIDEILSPDSSRFWDMAAYAPGRSQDSFDKQFVRDYLDTLDWNHAPPAPELPPDIVQKTLEKYREARNRLIG